jgi:4-hydroxy-3-methylbut-2-enyl diphosphate reductase IspH
MGFGYWSLSRYLKYKVKKAVDFVFKFEENLANYCKKRGFDGVICGHIHHAEIKEINGVMYMNDGDWVESCTALVEHWDGRWEIVTWTKEKDNVDTDTNSSSREQSSGRSGKNRTDIQRSNELRSSSSINEVAAKV